MQVKKFEAPTVAEALKLVKAELGPDAIILSTKNHRKGFGLLSKASVEVTAAVTDKSLAKKRITEKVVPQPVKEQIEKMPPRKQSEVYDEFADYYVGRKKERTAAKEAKAQAQAQAQMRSDEARHGQRMASRRYVDIGDEDAAAMQGGTGAYAPQPQPFPATQSVPAYGRNGRSMGAPTKNVFEGYHADLQSERIQKQYADAEADEVITAPLAPGQRLSRDAAAAERARREREETRQAERIPLSAEHFEEIESLQQDVAALKSILEELKSEQQSVADTRLIENGGEETFGEFQNLLRNGIEKKLAAQLMRDVSLRLGREGMRNSEKVTEAVAVQLMADLRFENPLDFKPGTEKKVIALVGPTGVGKTTTLAKLASQAILQKGLRVGLINVDSYKVAALDQLATYAKILNVPFRQAATPVELDRALTEFKPMDVILIDTSGRSQRDSASLSQLKTLLGEHASIKTMLILSATTRDAELYDILTRFKLFSPSGLVFSKLDESSTFGCVYNIAMKTKMPLTYFTLGQRVPEDIEVATKERVADLILDL